MSEEKKKGIIRKITTLVGAIAVCMVPIAIFVPALGCAFGLCSLSVREDIEVLTGLVALFFGLAFVGLILFQSRWLVQEAEMER